MTKLSKALGIAACMLPLAALVSPASAQQPAQDDATPPGAAKSAMTKALEAGAKALQDNAPLNRFDVYMVGFHPMKERPQMQVEAHHYCHQINEDFAQCALFDGNTRDARLHGIEYIISEKLFETLPPEERQYWHPHNGEILSGQLAAPDIPDIAEKSLMRTKINSYGKTWHLWNTGHAGHPADKLPLGPAMLAWSFNRDGELLPGLLEKRDKAMDIDSADKRRQRADLQKLAKPQSGVDDLKGRFGRPTRDIPGVMDKKSAAAAGPVPAD